MNRRASPEHLPHVDLQLLGAFRLVRLRRGLSVPPTAQRLLAFLALHGPCARSTASGSFWPDSSDGRARANLRTTLWRLAIGDASLVRVDGDTIAVHPTVVVDVSAFVEVVRRLGGNSPVCVADIESFLNSSGELLPGWHDDWVLLERARLHQLRLHGLEAAAHRLRRLRRFDLAVDAALRAVRIEPLRESAHRTLAEVHLTACNVSEAARCYREFAALLRDELDLAPSGAFRALFGTSPASDERPVSRRGGPSEPNRHGPLVAYRPPTGGPAPRL